MIDAAAEGGGAGDRDALALAARERLHGLADVLDRQQAERGQVLARASRCMLGAVEHAEDTAQEARLAPLAAEEHVVGDARAGDRARFW